MDEQIHKYGKWALVAGAAEGIGEAFSRRLAAKGMNLLMVDHNEPALHRLADELEKKYNIKVANIYLDLAQLNAPEILIKEIREKECRLLVYVAAFSRIDWFLNNTADDLERYTDVNLLTPLHLFHLFSKDLVDAKQPGGIIIMSSLAGMWGTRLAIPYGSTKAFNLILAESLFYELKPHGIDVLACVAGATSTPAYHASNPKYRMIKPKIQKPEEVAAFALKHLGRKAVAVSGFMNRMTVFVFQRILPRRWAAGIFNWMMKRMYMG